MFTHLWVFVSVGPTGLLVELPGHEEAVGGGAVRTIEPALSIYATVWLVPVQQHYLAHLAGLVQREKRRHAPVTKGTTATATAPEELLWWQEYPAQVLDAVHTHLSDPGGGPVQREVDIPTDIYAIEHGIEALEIGREPKRCILLFPKGRLRATVLRQWLACGEGHW